MKIGVIDIGSNSVRLMLWADGITLYKEMNSTRLGEGLSGSRNLLSAPMERTVKAICDFKEQALREGAKKVYVFATAAVRAADNGGEFVKLVYDACGLTVDVLSGEQEAKTGLLGALDGQPGGIIDVGGASTEVSMHDGEKVYTKSVQVGTVRIIDCCGRDLNKIEKFVQEKLSEFAIADLSGEKMCAVGGTATRLASIKHNLKEFKPEIVDGTVLTLQEVYDFAVKLTALSPEEIRRTTICSKSADLIGGGAYLLYAVMKRFNIEKITVSYKDNLEGYAHLKGAEK